MEDKTKSIMYKVSDAEGEAHPDYIVFCPGCECSHGIWTTNVKGGPTWKFDGNVKKPTFRPSLLVRYPVGDKMNICHSFIRGGRIQFLNDCTHELRGQTVDLPEF